VALEAVPSRDVFDRLGTVRLDAHAEARLLEPLRDVAAIEPDVVRLPEQPLAVFR